MFAYASRGKNLLELDLHESSTPLSAGVLQAPLSHITWICTESLTSEIDEISEIRESCTE